ncbi:hypothetical protein AC578_7226 [Pseudocercospora eumusae]|uniref:Uncharacterized protein n=1 Tax=Pseudocercospora eumusae TaxID=321146 RepID=A0A139HWC2_9PEZI|nr:hypothetical protein AC578_7226 [Pseudocercospora eumusae]
MHIQSTFIVPFSPYPSPPSQASSDTSYQHADEDFFSMGANTNPGTAVNVDGIGELNYQRAIDIARNSEGELDGRVSAYLETAISDIWTRITMSPDSYLMTQDEFAVFNFYRGRFKGEVAETAVARYWTNTYGSASAAI